MPGRNALFIPGPTNMPDRIRRAMDVPLEDHRSAASPKIVKPLLEDLKQVFRTDSGQVFIYSSSGTGCWEAGITNTLSPGDKVLIGIYGQFAVLWSQLCKRHNMDVIEIETEWGLGAPLESFREVLAADTNKEIKAVLVTHNETSTGVTTDVKAVRDLLNELDHPALLGVDGVSSIGSLEFRMDEWGVDLAVAGSQKGFMMPTGLGILGVSQKALEAHKTSKCPRGYFEWDDMISNNKDGYFPYTPAMTLIHGLRESVNMLLEEGMDNIAQRHQRYAEATRKAVDAWGLKLCAQRPDEYSNTVSAILAPEGIDSGLIVRTAFANYNLSLGGGLNKVAGKVFRIGHIGDMCETMLLSGLGGTEMALRDCGIDIEPGSGVGAASEYLRTTRQSV